MVLLNSFLFPIFADRFGTQWAFILMNVLQFIYIIKRMLTNLSYNVYPLALTHLLSLCLSPSPHRFGILGLFHFLALNGKKKFILLNELRAYS